MKTSLLNRRHFLQRTAAATLTAPFIARSSFSASPNSKLNHACVGVGGMGGADMQEFLKHKRTQIVALCDVDSNALKRAAERIPGARTYADWRELLANEGDKIDSVNVSVPDHMHFPVAMSAIQRGKHVYCQKPMCHDVAEVRALTEAAHRKQVVTQLGTQMASSSRDRTIVALLNSGAIGQVKHAYLCSNRPGAIEHYRLKGPRPAQGQQPPSHLNWDLWIGNAPMRPFAPDIYHPARWRAWQDFGTGWSGDIGCHIFNGVWKGMGMHAPKSVVAEVQTSWKDSPERRGDTWPQGDHITWIFPGNKLTESREWTVEWFDGEFFPPDDIRRLYSPDLSKYPPESAIIIGSEGALLMAEKAILLPEEKFQNFPFPQIDNRNHYHDFADACLNSKKAESDFSIVGPMTETVLLGTVAIRMPSQRLEWEAAGMKFSNCPAAEKFLKREYRPGWEV